MKKQISALWIIYFLLIFMIICSIGSCTNLLTVIKGQGNNFENKQETTVQADSSRITLKK